MEDVYIKSLQKLSSRLHSSSNNAVMTSIDSLGYERKEVDRQLGAWKGIQKQLENEVEEKARTSEAWRKKVVEEVEVPLRNSLNKPEWLRYSLLDQTLGGNVREYENTLDKVQKVSWNSLRLGSYEACRLCILKPGTFPLDPRHRVKEDQKLRNRRRRSSYPPSQTYRIWAQL